MASAAPIVGTFVSRQLAKWDRPCARGARPRLKGFNLGGAARWRAKPTIGYGVSTSSSGATVLDLDNAYKGKEEFYVDAILGYRGKLKAFGGFNYRLQVNVRNVLDDDSPIPV